MDMDFLLKQPVLFDSYSSSSLIYRPGIALVTTIQPAPFVTACFGTHFYGFFGPHEQR